MTILPTVTIGRPGLCDQAVTRPFTGSATAQRPYLCPQTLEIVLLTHVELDFPSQNVERFRVLLMPVRRRGDHARLRCTLEDRDRRTRGISFDRDTRPRGGKLTTFSGAEDQGIVGTLHGPSIGASVRGDDALAPAAQSLNENPRRANREARPR
jgi:hypothetical protein